MTNIYFGMITTLFKFTDISLKAPKELIAGRRVCLEKSLLGIVTNKFSKIQMCMCDGL